MVIVNAGLKSEAVIPCDQFKDDQGVVEVEIGDIVEVALDAVEDGFGETRLSREKAKRHAAWSKLESAFEAEETVVGLISVKVKGGFFGGKKVETICTEGLVMAGEDAEDELVERVSRILSLQIDTLRGNSQP